MLEQVIRRLTPVAHDSLGFENFIKAANIAWVPLDYIKELSEKGGPFPRRQDLDQQRLIVGKVPPGRKIVVSHGWDTASHISPSGSKMRLLYFEMHRLG